MSKRLINLFKIYYIINIFQLLQFGEVPTITTKIKMTIAVINIVHTNKRKFLSDVVLLL